MLVKELVLDSDTVQNCFEFLELLESINVQKNIKNCISL